MESKLEMKPAYPANGNLRMYNMFPFRRYVNGDIGIKNMSCYVHEIAEMGYNAVWINPLQATGTMKQDHPDGERQVSGSLYAMADDQAFNPLIFPNSTQSECEVLLKAWTQEVRNNDMFPLFDLVLNHIAINEGQDTSLAIKLMEAGALGDLQLMLPEVHERWPDIQGLDYYATDSKKRGLNTEPMYLDTRKIDLIFETLWEPMICRYIVDYGFMGVRVDALTHVPVPVQQRAYRLIQKLVWETHGTDAIIVGEFMAANPSEYILSLAACGLTHCLNPYSFYWGHNKEGGYCNDSERSPFFKQTLQLAEIVLSSPANIRSLKNLIISTDNLDESRKLQKNTIYIFRRKESWYVALNTDATDICFSKAAIHPLSLLKDELLLNILNNFENGGLSSTKNNRDYKKQILQKLHDSPILQKLYTESRSKPLPGGLIGVLGNHDVGTLKAKCMLDIVYGFALDNAIDSGKIKLVETSYKNFKNMIKGARNTDDLVKKLLAEFDLSPGDVQQIQHYLPMRMREKIFIQSMMCTGGWYSIAGDEFAVCHKPEVFSEFARDGGRVGASLESVRADCNEYNFTQFIRSINDVLTRLPAASCNDKNSMHQVNMEDAIRGKISTELLFMVLRYCAKTQEYYLITHSRNPISTVRLKAKLADVLDTIPFCKVVHIAADGTLLDAAWSKGKLEPCLEPVVLSSSNAENSNAPTGLQSFGIFGYPNTADNQGCSSKPTLSFK